MISLPERGIATSRHKHNVDRVILCDWLEASILFKGDALSGSDIVDVLMENGIYLEQTLAWELANDLLSMMSTRAVLMGDGYPLEPTTYGYAPKGFWDAYAPYAFCLMLSLAKSHGNWIAETFGSDYNEQGSLFEDLTAEAVALSFQGWTVHSTGWTRVRTSQIHNVVADICSKINETAGEILRWTSAATKEAGLDLISWRPFEDGTIGVPIYLWQCASGMDWERKRSTPNLELWSRLITWTVRPGKAMAMPFALSEQDMRQSSVLVAGPLLDRHRLLEPGLRERDWVSDDLKERLIDWLWPRVASLPMLDHGL